MSVTVSIFICFYGFEKNDCHFYICLPYFKVWNFRWNIVSRNLLYRVSVAIFAGTSFCSLCQNLRKPQKLFQFPQGMYFSLKSFLTFFRLSKITRIKNNTFWYMFWNKIKNSVISFEKLLFHIGFNIQLNNCHYSEFWILTMFFWSIMILLQK